MALWQFSFGGLKFAWLNGCDRRLLHAAQGVCRGPVWNRLKPETAESPTAKEATMATITFFGHAFTDVPDRHYYMPSQGKWKLSFTVYQPDKAEKWGPNGTPVTYLVTDQFIDSGSLEDALGVVRSGAKAPGAAKAEVTDALRQRLKNGFEASKCIGFFWATVTGTVQGKTRTEYLAGMAPNMINGETNSTNQKISQLQKDPEFAPLFKAEKSGSKKQGKKDSKAEQEETSQKTTGKISSFPEFPVFYAAHTPDGSNGQVHFEAIASSQIRTFLEGVKAAMQNAWPHDFSIQIDYEWVSKKKPLDPNDPRTDAHECCGPCQKAIAALCSDFQGTNNQVVAKEQVVRWKCPTCLKIISDLDYQTRLNGKNSGGSTMEQGAQVKCANQKCKKFNNVLEKLAS